MNNNRDISVNDERAEAALAFEKCFSVPPQWLAVSPGKVNVIGEHIDYCDGFVLPLAIDRYVTIAFALNGTSQANLVSGQFPDDAVTMMLDEEQKPSPPAWANYVRGVLEGFRQRDFWPLPGFDAYIYSSIPMSAGLSSSAAIEVAVATMIEGLLGIKIDPVRKEKLCQRAEQTFTGMPCGIMDQTSCIFSKKDHLLLIDCLTKETADIAFDSKKVSVVIADSKIQRRLSEGNYANRRKQTDIALSALNKKSWRDVSDQDLEIFRDAMSEVVFRRARHVVGEIRRTQLAAKHIANGEFDKVGELMRESHLSLRDDFQVSCKELDILVEAAWEMGPEAGVIGSRMVGGGFGGSTVSLVESSKVGEFIKKLKDNYRIQTNIEPEVFQTSAVAGARLLEV